MPLIVEDGTGLADAESLCSVAVATAYHALRGNAAWAALATDALREQALRKGTQAMYGYRWKGSRMRSTQALDWPRYGVLANGYSVLSTVVPLTVQHACAELALRAAAADLLPDVSAPVTSKTVGPISVTYAPGARQTKRYQAVDLMLSGYVSGSGASIEVVRA